MWPLRKKIGKRRQEVRKGIRSRRQRYWQRFVQAGGPLSVLISLLFFVMAAAIVIFPLNPSTYRLGQYEPRRYARVRFDMPSEERTRKKLDQVENETPATFKADEELFNRVRGGLSALPGQFDIATQPANLEQKLLDQYGIATEEDFKTIKRYTSDTYRARWTETVDAVLKGLANLAIVSPEDYQWDRRRDAIEFYLVGPSGRIVKSRGALISTDETARVKDLVGELVRSAERMPDLRPYVEHYIEMLILEQGLPTYVRDRDVTDRAIELAKAGTPQQMLPYEPGAVIHETGRIDAGDLRLLQTEHAAYLASLQDPNRPRRLAIGLAGMTALVTVLLAAHVARYQGRVVRNHWRGLALTALLGLILFFGKSVANLSGWNPYLTAGMVVMGAMIVTIAYDQRFALTVGAVLAILMTLAMRTSVGFFVVLMAGVAVSVFALNEIRTRSKVIEVGGLAAVAAFAATMLVELAQNQPLAMPMLTDCCWAALSVLAVGFVIQGILPLIERVFRIATSMTLLEWCDANKKLFKRLAMEAPGTYNHSLMLGTLCEAAAESIKANSLLARVGAYYHDIGKINKPEYFIENQLGSPNKHTKLSPAMSLLIIVGHIKDGLELAREYNLPPALHEFIASHHGTTLVRYFYHAATEKSRVNGAERPPAEVEFRYPGPKPRSKEAAILMMADASESSVRAMTDPTPARIEAQVHQITTDRLMDGQFDEANPTLREVHQIEQSLVKSLCGIYHGRIAYPSASSKSEEAEPKAEPKAAGA